ncbi:MAG: SDR family oxidoreductase [Deltaproteobacteria bacterium]|nr:SDR family oxidoreductase [Deltaproteobacteria bacterium]
MPRKVLVTGGAGFIGSHVVDRLLKDGRDVVVIDNFSTGRPENLEHHKQNTRLRLVQADINDREKIAVHFQGADWVIHVAALADVVPSIERPLDYHRSNVDGTITVLECARAAGVKRFVYAASSSCYGIPDAYPTPETAPMRPQYPYALTKLLGEEYVLGWGRIYKMPVVSLRFFNVYGPRSRTSGTYGAVFGVFLAQKLQKKALTVVGDGTQSRDFTFVTDVVNAIVTAAESDVCNEAMNVGSGNHYSVNLLVKLLGEPVTHVPKRPGEPDITFADTTKIRARLGWRPRISFEEGVAQMLKNIEYWRNAPVWTPESINEATKTWFQYLS